MTDDVRPHRRSAAVLLGLALTAGPAATAAATPASSPDESTRPVGAQLAQVRAATARYHDVAAAIADGYAPASPCVPSMGFHFQRHAAGTDPETGDPASLPVVTTDAAELDPASPEILVYAPRPDGRLGLVAVEYATWDPDAELFGRPFDAPHEGGPPFHTLHAWVWQGNPAGMFEPLNPNVRCD